MAKRGKIAWRRDAKPRGHKGPPKTSIAPLPPTIATIDPAQELEHQSGIVLRGANDLRERLLIAMATGSPSIAELAYAVKVRVKEDYKIVEKVFRKRGKDPSYDVHRLRDIVGVRIVTLYRLDALRIIPLLLEKLKTEAVGPTALFVPESIEELLIYTNNPDGDAQDLPGRIMDIFGAFGLAEKAHRESAATNYTSIHLVAFGRGKYKDGYREIPIEIQIRTALEDVWGEIDHTLKYKRKTLSAPNTPGKRRLDSVLSHLNVMKTLIDGTAQYADQIKIQLDELDQDYFISASSRQAEDAIELLSPLEDLPADIFNRVKSAVKHEREALSELASQSKEDEALALTNLHAAREELDLAIELAKTAQLSEASRGVVAYVLEMERALVLFELGKKVESGANLLAEAATVYRKYEQLNPKTVVAKYRHAAVLDALGDRSSAKAKFIQTVKLIDDGMSGLPEGHWIRSAAPRYLGMMYWEEAYGIEKSSLSSDNPALLEQRHRLYLRAFECTKKAHEIDLDETIAGTGEPVSVERERVVNNLIYYALEYLESGGDVKNLKSLGFKDGDLEKLLGEMNRWNQSADVVYLDTLRRAFVFTKQASVAVQVAKKIVRLMKEYRKLGLVASKHQSEIFHDAEVTIQRAGRKLA